MVIYNYDYDVAAIVIYLIITCAYHRKKHIRNSAQLIFVCLMASAIIAPLTDILGGRAIEAHAGWTFTVWANTIYYLAMQGTIFFFMLYIMAQLEMRNQLALGKRLLLILPVVISMLIIVSTPYTGAMFTYVDGVFSRGYLHVICYFIPIFYYVWCVLYVNKHKSMYTLDMRILVYLVLVINLAPSIIQYVLQEYLLRCFAFSISMFMFFIIIQDHEADIDPKTGMASKSYLSTYSSKMIYNHYSFTSILVRVGDYDLLTTQYGVANTESLMTDIAKYLQSMVRVGSAFRISNSCYVIQVRKDRAEKLQKDIYEKMSKAWMVNDMEIVCSAFITCITYPDHFTDMDGYMAYLTYFEKMHRMRYGIIPPEELEVKDKIREQKVENAIEKGLKNGNMRVYYQPICVANNQRFITAEALVRLIDDKLGFISPGEFIPLAERNGSIIAIGKFVLETVCDFIEHHDMEALGLEYIELNLSTIQCLQRDFISTIDEVTARHHVDSKYLCFEITETAANCAPAIFTNNLQMLVERGYKLALDDFGTGYANLQRMVTSSFDIIKFDKEMTQQTFSEERLMGVFTKMQAMFHSMGSHVVAEGVETKEQYEFLRDSGCDYIQGFYFSKPVPEEEFCTFLKEHLQG